MSATTVVPRLHTCDICGKTEAWNKAWSWYGSYRQMEEGENSILKVCSDACKPADPNQARARKENPADKIEKAKEAMEMGRKLRKGKPGTFTNPRGLPKGLPEKPTPVEALQVAVDTLRYMKQDNVAEWCARGLTWPT